MTHNIREILGNTESEPLGAIDIIPGCIQELLIKETDDTLSPDETQALSAYWESLSDEDLALLESEELSYAK